MIIYAQVLINKSIMQKAKNNKNPEDKTTDG